MIYRRLALAALLLVVVAGCDTATGPVVPSTTGSNGSPAAPTATANPTAEKPTDRGKALNAGEPQPGGLPTAKTTY
ncbi:MAG: hypothetical protein JWN86_839 [Planctomycetota bacterium]|nr:hypothetical protein [Planctomycetota bacterium]